MKYFRRFFDTFHAYRTLKPIKGIPFNLLRLKLVVEKDAFNAILAVKGWKPLIRHLLNVSGLIVGGLNRNWVRLTIVIIRRLEKIRHEQGSCGLVKYLKVCSVCLQQHLGGHYERDLTSLGPRVSRTGKGIPRVLPATVRKSISEGDSRSVRFALTIFALYRVIYFPGKLKLSTITAARTTSLQAERRLYTHISTFIRLFIGKRNNGLQSLRPPRPFEILKGSPNSLGAENFEYSSHPFAVVRSMIALYQHPRLMNQLEEFRKLLPASPEFDRVWLDTNFAVRLQFVEWCRTLNFTPTLGRPIRGRKWHPFKVSPVVALEEVRDNLSRAPFYMRYWVGRYGFLRSLGLADFKRAYFLGRLGLKEEAAGKIRVFAMVDCFTQWLMNPLHKYLFGILRTIPMDGTFDQMKPLNKVPFGERPLYSFDLSAATDRLPISLQKALLSKVFGQKFADLWANILVGRDYELPKSDFIGEDSPKSIRYAVGQPMGALSSWAMLAFTHHFIVQCAAWETGYPKDRLFQDYAVLGDDIVIWDAKVASKYHKIVLSLGVEVGLAKSIISPLGSALEFAKKTIWKGEDVSPISLTEYSSALESTAAFVHFVRKYEANEAFVKNCLGIGYRAHPFNLRWRIWALLLRIPSVWSDLSADLLSSFLHSHTTLIVKLIQDKCKTLKDRVTNVWSNLIQDITKREVEKYNLHLGTFWYNIYKYLDDALYGAVGLQQHRALAEELFLLRGRARQLWDMVQWWRVFEIREYLEAYDYGLYPLKAVLPVKVLESDMDQDTMTELWSIPDNGRKRQVSREQLDQVLKDLFFIEDKIASVSQTGPSSVLSNERRLSPLEKDRIRVRKAWNAWSSIVLQTYSISGFGIPIPFLVDMFRRLFLVTSTTSQALRMRTIVGRNLRRFTLTNPHHVGYRTVLWITLFDMFLTLGTMGTLFSLASVLISLVAWWNSGESVQALVPLVATSFEPFKVLVTDVLDLAKLVNADNISSMGTITSLSLFYGFIVLNTIYQNIGNIIHVLITNLHWPGWDLSLLIGAPLGIFYEYGIYPIVGILKLPYHILWTDMTWSAAVMGNPWLCALRDTGEAFFSVIASDIEWIKSCRMAEYSVPDLQELVLNEEETSTAFVQGSSKDKIVPEYIDPFAKDVIDLQKDVDTGSDSSESTVSPFSQYFKEPSSTQFPSHPHICESDCVTWVDCGESKDYVPLNSPKPWGWIALGLVGRHLFAVSVVLGYTVYRVVPILG